MKQKALIFAGLAILTCGALSAEAQEVIAVPSAQTIEAPNWDQNFTFSESLSFEADSMFLPEKAQSYQFGGSGRWQMNLERVTRPEDSPLPREEMRAGATYSFTPRFSLGGSVSVGAQELNDVSTWKEQNVEAGVKLKTTFKF